MTPNPDDLPVPTSDREGPHTHPAWTFDTTSEVFHFSTGDFAERPFYAVHIEDELFEDAWMSSDCFCDVAGENYSNQFSSNSL